MRLFLDTIRKNTFSGKSILYVISLTGTHTLQLKFEKHIHRYTIQKSISSKKYLFIDILIHFPFEEIIFLDIKTEKYYAIHIMDSLIKEILAEMPDPEVDDYGSR